MAAGSSDNSAAATTGHRIMGSKMHPPMMAAPSGSTLLTLEQKVRRTGTGLTAADLLGRWQLQQVWPKAGGQPSVLSGRLLRALDARLEIAGEGDGDLLQLGNAVTLGLLELRFDGHGRLQGRRPLLQFWFERLSLTLAGRPLLQRPLPAPAPGRTPFFALIHRDDSGWLAARGRGGGLALWQRNDAP